MGVDGRSPLADSDGTAGKVTSAWLHPSNVCVLPMLKGNEGVLEPGVPRTSRALVKYKYAPRPSAVMVGSAYFEVRTSKYEMCQRRGRGAGLRVHAHTEVNLT